MRTVSSAFQVELLEKSISSLWKNISLHYSIDESVWLSELLEHHSLSDSSWSSKIEYRTTKLIEAVRQRDDAMLMIDALLLQYDLSTREGILLMCLAEALIRIPDAQTADALIKDKLSIADWNAHLNQSDSFLVNASTWGLMLTGKFIRFNADDPNLKANTLNRLMNKLGEPVVRQAVNQAMKIIGKHFVLGRNIKEALKNGNKSISQGFTYSFDMLGEAALTAGDAIKYQKKYLEAINLVGDAKNNTNDIDRRYCSSVSIKLSALHPRYEVAQQDRVMNELFDSVLVLIKAARSKNVSITIDAEEQDRLELSLKLFEKLYNHPSCYGWGGFGLVVQAYGKRALPVLVWLAGIAKKQGDQIPIRLVKGAYWDSEIKHCQQQGIDGYPVYTRKEATDLAYLVCAQFMLQSHIQSYIYPQFASHNAHTICSIIQMANHGQLYEFQRLHGMGEALYKTIKEQIDVPVRIYAPVGSHQDLLPYLVRRLLENGANSSFVHRLVDAKTPVSELVHHPVDKLILYPTLANNRIPIPRDIFEPQRLNSLGANLNIESQSQHFFVTLQSFMEQQWHKKPIIYPMSEQNDRLTYQVHTPYCLDEFVGSVEWSNEQDIAKALDNAELAFINWQYVTVEHRATCLEKLALLLEKNQYELIALCHKEAGKTLQDAIDEIREAVDFCRYYAVQARKNFSNAVELVGPTGESNELYFSARGVFVCISPWNFPLAIFLGQVVAALVTGNSVIAKPAEQTSLIAARTVELILESGVPQGVIQLLTGKGATIGQHLLNDTRVAGVVFTGSTETAKWISQTLANRPGAIVPFIAETGGQNAMIVDSTALPEQVVIDVIQSAFSSAGQRCSALRVLYVQQDIADNIIELLVGAMQEIRVGNPTLYKTDIGPVIDKKAYQGLKAYIDKMKDHGGILLSESTLTKECQYGHFIEPVAFEINSISQLEKEQFGPILHVVRYKNTQIDQIIESINQTGYGLTLGIHSRNEKYAQYIAKNIKVGNVYINRNQIGAAVGVQPFGGQGLSGTGPKAGGPHYLYRFVTERTRTINTTAVGGNATLLSLDETDE